MATERERYVAELSDLSRKKRLFVEFKAQVDWDNGRPFDLQYNYKAPASGGPKHQYWVKTTDFGVPELVSPPNDSYCSDDRTESGRHINNWARKGYHRISGKELSDLVDTMQSDHIDVKQRLIDSLNPDKPKPGRRANV